MHFPTWGAEVLCGMHGEHAASMHVRQTVVCRHGPAVESRVRER